MKSKNIIILLVLLIVIFIMFYSFMDGSGDESYTRQILKEREEKDRFMKTADDSPVPENERASFRGLKYFEPDSKYRVVANLTPADNKKLVVLQTSDGKTERYVEYAYADFSIDGVENRLTILEIIDMGPFRGKLFLAFGDKTSANETYGAGRYLDLSKVPGATTITLDFNKAYNPYCAYNDTFSCPFPPRENLLNVAIRAGEKNYKES
jgi:uncharacterized protein (DUF1684 family)